jgi:hypothetical protein
MLEKNFMIMINGVLRVSLDSVGKNQIDVNDMIDFMNQSSRDALLKRFNTLLRNNNENINQNLELDKEVMMKLLVQENNLDESDLKYYIKNFDSLFNEDIYFSLNGWEIDSNKFNIIEILLSSLLFGLLISSFFLFLKSDYFKRSFID